MKKYDAKFTLTTSYGTTITVDANEERGVEVTHRGNGTQDQVISFTADEVDDLISMLRDAKLNLTQ